MDEVLKVGLDLETLPIGETERVCFPAPVCAQFACRTAMGGSLERTWEDSDHPFHGIFVCMYGTDEPGMLKQVIEWLLDSAHIYTANGSYDFNCIVGEWPDLYAKVFEAYEAGRIHDVFHREKLRVLSTAGHFTGLGFNLKELEKDYFGFDRSDEKDAIRNSFGPLHGRPLSEYSQEQIDYALDDAASPLRIAEIQERSRSAEGFGSINTSRFQAAAQFALDCLTAEGFATDPERVAHLKEHLEEQLSEDRIDPLYESGLINRGVPSRPWKNQPNKWTKAEKPKKNMVAIHTHFKDVWLRMGVDEGSIPKTATGQISTDKDVLTQLAGKDELLDLYAHRQHYITLHDTFLPKLITGRVFGKYDTLKKSGRTSSRGFKKGKELYAATNMQNQPRLVGEYSVRECYIPDVGWVLWAVDYRGQELVSLANKLVVLFGHSSLADLINDGVDAHAYLGAQLCAAHHPDFGALLTEQGITDRRRIYETFQKMCRHEKPELAKIWKQYRTFAKPVGLGYPGGLMYETFCVVARSDHGLEFTLEEAELFRKVWLESFPEMSDYFRFINKCKDPNSQGAYAYTTPLGMYRAGATYCATCNGVGLQSPTAEGAKAAVFDVVRACKDPTRDSVLYGSRPKVFVHDEIVGQSPYATDEDKLLITDRVNEVSRLMIEAMQPVMTHVKVSTDVSLMTRWMKDAEAAYDDRGTLVPYSPKM